jgi:hypothetical protein
MDSIFLFSDKLLGLGAKYSFTDAFGIRVEMDWYKLGSGSDRTRREDDMYLFSVGGVFSF